MLEVVAFIGKGVILLCAIVLGVTWHVTRKITWADIKEVARIGLIAPLVVLAYGALIVGTEWFMTTYAFAVLVVVGIPAGIFWWRRYQKKQPPDLRELSDEEIWPYD